MESIINNRNYFIHESSYADDGCVIGDGTKIWHFSHVQSGAQIGEDCTIGQNVNVASNVTIGNKVKIQNNVSVYEGVELEDYVFCGPSIVFTNIRKPRSEFPQRGGSFYQKTLVKKSASIGANATILCGITIGQYSIIGAGSVITKDVKPFSLVVGNPARQISWINKIGDKLMFAKDNKSICGKFQLIDNNLIEL